jgi:serine/threonine protein kinase
MLTFDVRAFEVARGMEHRADVLHHDLRSTNVLMGPKGERRCRITDFGLSKTKLQSSRFSKKITGNPGWCAPEYLAGTSPFTAACDVLLFSFSFFVFGVLLFEICSGPPGTPPFEGQSGDNFRSLYMEGKRPLLHDGVDPDLARLIVECWHQEPSKRPTFSRLVQLVETSGKAGAAYTV